MSTSIDSDTEDLTPEPPPARSGVRWKRFGAMFGITGILTGALVALTAQGVLAANFSLSGLPFVVTATSLEGQGFEQFATADHFTDHSPWKSAANGDGQPVAIVSAIDQANLTKLCQSVDMGGLFMKITAGDAGTDVTAKTLVVDSEDINGDASFKKINIGQDVSEYTEVPGVNPVDDSGKPVEGIFGQQADHVEILNLRQDNWATTAAVFNLPHLRMSFTTSGC